MNSDSDSEQLNQSEEIPDECPSPKPQDLSLTAAEIRVKSESELINAPQPMDTCQDEPMDMVSTDKHNAAARDMDEDVNVDEDEDEDEVEHKLVTPETILTTPSSSRRGSAAAVSLGPIIQPSAGRREKYTGSTKRTRHSERFNNNNNDLAGQQTKGKATTKRTRSSTSNSQQLAVAGAIQSHGAGSGSDTTKSPPDSSVSCTFKHTLTKIFTFSQENTFHSLSACIRCELLGTSGRKREDC